MARATAITPPSAAIKRFARQRARNRAPRTYPRSVFRFRTIEKAQAARDRITEENAGRGAGRKPAG